MKKFYRIEVDKEEYDLEAVIECIKGVNEAVEIEPLKDKITCNDDLYIILQQAREYITINKYPNQKILDSLLYIVLDEICTKGGGK